MQSILDYGAGFFKENIITYSGNVLLSLSGGRSSAAMLRLMLDQYGGTLPDNFKIVFNNTGKEHPATYTFLQRIQDEWKVEVAWLELTGFATDRMVTYKHVTNATASRNGEPFYVLMEHKLGFPPRRANRLCTLYMKVLPALSYAEVELGWTDYTQLFGYRHDELHRLHNAKMRCGKSKLPYVPDAPLIRAVIDKAGVLAFFAQAAFDLEIPDNCGNCVFCFLKDETKLRRVMQHMPGEIDWWIALEKHWGTGTDKKYAEQYTMMPNGGYKGIKERAERDMPSIADENLEDLECNCTD